MTSTATPKPDETLREQAREAFLHHRAAARAAVLASAKTALSAVLARTALRFGSRIAGKRFSIARTKGNWLVISTGLGMMEIDLKRVASLSFQAKAGGEGHAISAGGESIDIQIDGAAERAAVDRFLRKALPVSGAAAFLRMCLAAAAIMVAGVMIAGISANRPGRDVSLRTPPLPGSSAEAPPGSPEDRAALMRAMRGGSQPNR